MDWAWVGQHTEHLLEVLVANAVMLPLVRRHLKNLHKRVRVIEDHLLIEPTTPAPPFGLGELAAEVITDQGGRR